jgi:amino acid adenylation domain-containing protein
MQGESLQQSLIQTARNYADKVAIEWLGNRVNYRDLEAGAIRVAKHLVAAGSKKGDVVALMFDDRIKLVQAILGVFKSGSAFAPLSQAEPDKRLQSMMAEILPATIMVESEQYERALKIVSAAGLQANVTVFEEVDRGSDEKGENAGSNFNQLQEKGFVAGEPEDMIYLYFTSGSTGTPKAVAGQTKGLLHFINWEIDSFDIDDSFRISQLAAPTFDAYLRDIFVPLSVGATICIPDNREMVLDASHLIEWIEDSKVSLIHCVPSIFRALVKQPLKPEQFGALKYIIMSGEPIHPAEVERWLNVFDERVQLVSLYGATELTMAKFCYLIEKADKDRRIIPVGKPIVGTRAVILNEEGKLCDPGLVGEVYVRTPYRTLGYYRDPELTRKVFIQNVFSNNPSDLIYKTGDYGRLLPDGNFELLGRKDHQIKIRGLRVELGEIESALKRHAGVAESVVVLKGDNPDEQRLVSYVVATNDQQPSAAELRVHCRELLPAHMVPAVFLLLDSLPLTSNGKVDRKALPDPEDLRREDADNFVAPTTEVEKEIAEIWSEVLRVDNIGIHDSFFDLGGHSLRATQVVARLREAFQIELPLRTIFEKPSISELSAVITEIKEAGEKQSDMSILDYVENLSDDEITALLGQMEA